MMTSLKKQIHIFYFIHKFFIHNNINLKYYQNEKLWQNVINTFTSAMVSVATILLSSNVAGRVYEPSYSIPNHENSQLSGNYLLYSINFDQRNY